MGKRSQFALFCEFTVCFATEIGAPGQAALRPDDRVCYSNITFCNSFFIFAHPWVEVSFIAMTAIRCYFMAPKMIKSVTKRVLVSLRPWQSLTGTGPGRLGCGVDERRCRSTVTPRTFHFGKFLLTVTLYSYTVGLRLSIVPLTQMFLNGHPLFPNSGWLITCTCLGRLLPAWFIMPASRSFVLNPTFILQWGHCLVRAWTSPSWQCVQRPIGGGHRIRWTGCYGLTCAALGLVC